MRDLSQQIKGPRNDLGVEMSRLDENTLSHECKSVKTSLPRDLNLRLVHSSEEVDQNLQRMYRAIVGSLMDFYQWTRSDLGFAVFYALSVTFQDAMILSVLHQVI